MSSAKKVEKSVRKKGERENTLAASLTRNFGAEGITSRGKRERRRKYASERIKAVARSVAAT